MPTRPIPNLVIRTLSAVIFVPAVLVLVRAGDWLLLLLVLLIVGRGSWEFYYMARQAGSHPGRHLGLGLSIALCVYIYGLGTEHLVLAIAVVALSTFAMALLEGTEDYTRNALLTLGGVIYLGLLGSAPLLIVWAGTPDHRVEAGYLLALLFLCIWLTDAAAFLVGRRWGRRPLAPGISPRKTVVGSVAGTLAGVLPAAFHPYMASFTWAQLVVLMLLASLGGQLGDLVESAIKRDMGVKDAPQLIPGHGGALDRFDSYLFAFPLAYLYIRLLDIFH